jgi:hypothetical protein
MDRSVVALFDDVNTAQRALEELLRSGFDRNDVSVVRTNQKGGYTTGTGPTDVHDTSGAAAGVGIGAALGGIAGLVIGLGVIAIPGIGPIVAAGPLATTLAGAGIGAAAGGIIGALTDVGIPEEEAGYYAEGVRRGGTLLTVRADESQVNRARDIMNRYSPIDINERSAQWRSTGWSGFNPNAGPYEETSTGMGTASSYSGTGSMGTTGQYAGMSGTSSGSTGRFEDFDSDFRRDWETRYRNTGYGYERYQPAYRYGYELGNRYQGRDWNDIQSNVQSDWQRNHPNDKWEDFKDSIRTGWERFTQGVSNTAQDVRQGARDTAYDTERTYDRTTSDMSRSYDTYDPYFRSDWQRAYGSSGRDYSYYQPAYMYGYTLATDSRYPGRDWTAVEADARRNWESQHPDSKWEDFKDAVRDAWQRVKSDVKDATS